MVQRPPRASEIERVVLERQSGRVALDEHRVRRCIRARGSEQLRDEVDADDVPDERRERQRQRSRAGAGVEHALVSAEGREERLQLLAQALDLTPRVRGNALGGLGEARAHGVVVAHASTTSRLARRGCESMPVTIS